MSNRNIPYVKQFDKNGELTNPINGAYKHEFENRKKRRAPKNKERFMNNRKTMQTVVFKTHRFLKMIQHVRFFNKETEKFEIRRIEHYVPPTR